MVCIYDDGNGWCSGRFRDFGCIKGRCDDFAPSTKDRGECTGIEGKGTYCYRYNRFYCAGMENCTDQRSYIRKLEMSTS
ncbi:MAG: hypothetical protein V3U20_09335 [Thermoplasmata archaeon]